MSTFQIVLLVIMLILLAGVIAVYFIGRKAQKQQVQAQEQMDAVAQQVVLMIFDKKRLKLSQSGLPQAVIDQAPWYTKLAKVPIVKCKVATRQGDMAVRQTVNLIAEESIFDSIPVNKEVRATVSGLYITKVKQLHGKPLPVPEKKKKGLRAWALRKQKELNNQK